MVDLKPCPFCGSTSLVRNFYPTEGIISCACGARIICKTEDEKYELIGDDIFRKIPRKLGGAIAVERWNRRTEP